MTQKVLNSGCRRLVLVRVCSRGWMKMACSPDCCQATIQLSPSTGCHVCSLWKRGPVSEYNVLVKVSGGAADCAIWSWVLSDDLRRLSGRLSYSHWRVESVFKLIGWDLFNWSVLCLFVALLGAEVSCCFASMAAALNVVSVLLQPRRNILC